MATRVPAVAGKVINIGRAGENLATIVEFDVADWIRDFGNSGFFSLYVQQGGGGYYPQNLVRSSAAELTNNIVEWEVTNSNTAIVGLGKCELVYAISGENDNSIIVKSIIYDIVVTNSLDIEAQGSVPSAIESWINEVSQMVDQINDAANQADKAERYAKGTSNGVAVASGTVGYNDNAKYYSDKVGNMTTTTTTSGAGTNASVAITTIDNHYNLAFTIPRGNTGATGATGSAATITIGNVTTGNAGTDASVSNSGTSNAAVFNFTIPKGDKGDKGDGFTGPILNASNMPTANSTYANKIYLDTNNHIRYVTQSGSNWSWQDNGAIGGIIAKRYNWTSS